MDSLSKLLEHLQILSTLEVEGGIAGANLVAGRQLIVVVVVSTAALLPLSLRLPRLRPVQT